MSPLHKSVILSFLILFLMFVQKNSCQLNSTNSVSNNSNSSTINKSSGSGSSSSNIGGSSSVGGVGGNTASSSVAAAVSDEDLEKLLEDKRYLMRQIKCALGEGVCDPVGRRLKSLAPLVLRGACPKCSPSDKRQIQKTLSYVQRNYPKDWSRLMATYTG